MGTDPLNDDSKNQEDKNILDENEQNKIKKLEDLINGDNPKITDKQKYIKFINNQLYYVSAINATQINTYFKNIIKDNKITINDTAYNKFEKFLTEQQDFFIKYLMNDTTNLQKKEIINELLDIEEMENKYPGYKNYINTKYSIRHIINEIGNDDNIISNNDFIKYIKTIILTKDNYKKKVSLGGVSTNITNNYPFYKNLYVLNVSNIRELVAKFTPQIFVGKEPLPPHKKNSTAVAPSLKKLVSFKQYLELQKIRCNKTCRKNNKISLRDRKHCIVIIDKWKDNTELNNLTDYFSEHVRITCQFGKEPSAAELWAKYSGRVGVRGLDLSLQLRDQFYCGIRVCNNFRVSVALAVLQIFRPKRWLDISAGWGDRLLAALLFRTVELYFSTDPNLKLQKCYREMIRTFKDGSGKYIVKTAGFETVKIPYADFDLVFSSPPFFDLEKYSTYKNDSITQFTTETAWCDNFLLPSVLKAGEHLKDGGVIVLYIAAGKETMQKLFQSMGDNQYIYCGIIYFFETKYRAMYVWRLCRNL